MKLWRIDSTFDGRDDEKDLDGSRFFVEERDARIYAANVRAGWFVDVYQEDVGDLDEESLNQLLFGPLLQLPIAELLRPVTGNMAKAKRQLQSALKHRGNSKARIAWEKE
jgi:hypothetical protein